MPKYVQSQQLDYTQSHKLHLTIILLGYLTMQWTETLQFASQQQAKSGVCVCDWQFSFFSPSHLCIYAMYSFTIRIMHAKFALDTFNFVTCLNGALIDPHLHPVSSPIFFLTQNSWPSKQTPGNFGNLCFRKYCLYNLCNTALKFFQKIRVKI